MYLIHNRHYYDKINNLTENNTIKYDIISLNHYNTIHLRCSHKNKAIFWRNNEEHLLNPDSIWEELLAY